MHMTRREFLQALAIAAASGFALSRYADAASISGFYDLHDFGSNVTLLHFTDSHAQLLPTHYREPNTNIGVGEGVGKPPHLVGEAFLRYYLISKDSRVAHADTYLDYARAAQTYGAMGGYAYLATLVKKIKDQRPNSLLLDGGDTWQGSATALWTKGQDMVEASKLLGVSAMTGHWEFTYGAERVKQIVNSELKGRIDFVAQNVTEGNSGEPVFQPYTIKNVSGVPIAIMGQAFPYTPVAHPRYFTPDWTFGIQEENLKKWIADARKRGATLVVLLSHNGMAIDLKLARRVGGINVILGGHTHDAVPQPVLVKNDLGYTLVTNAGSNGKFLGILDLQVDGGRITGYQYRLAPVFSNLLEPDREMDAHIKKIRTPFEKQLKERLATTEGLLYRRDNFNGPFDQVILDALMEVKGAEIALSPGFRWGTTLLPGDPIHMEDLMNQTAITYPQSTLNELTGEQIKSILEDACDNVFNPDPYYQQGGDMVRVGGLRYTCNPTEAAGKRLSNLTLNGRPLEAGKRYKVASWAPGAEGATGEPVWEVVGQYLRAQKVVRARESNSPTLVGVSTNPGYAAEEAVTRPAAAPAASNPVPAKAPAPRKAAPKKG
jgi:sulfur-oxidizing protein SoxB